MSNNRRRYSKLNYRGSADNIFHLYCNTQAWEREVGYAYYDVQRGRLQQRAHEHNLPLSSIVGAFAALSPNASELNNYQALDTCIGIATGKLPIDTKVAAYGINKAKALKLLNGSPVDSILKGRKVTAFYNNTLNPDNSYHVTIDGHAFSAWAGQRVLMKTVPYLGAEYYRQISNDYIYVSNFLNIPTPRLQAILWIAWKRIHSIVYTPQLQLPLMEKF